MHMRASITTNERDHTALPNIYGLLIYCGGEDEGGSPGPQEAPLCKPEPSRVRRCAQFRPENADRHALGRCRSPRTGVRGTDLVCLPGIKVCRSTTSIGREKCDKSKAKDACDLTRSGDDAVSPLPYILAAKIQSRVSLIAACVRAAGRVWRIDRLGTARISRRNCYAPVRLHLLSARDLSGLVAA